MLEPVSSELHNACLRTVVCYLYRKKRQGMSHVHVYFSFLSCMLPKLILQELCCLRDAMILLMWLQIRQ